MLLSNAAAPSGDTSNAVTRYHIESEAAVRESGLDWTFLQPRTLMTNTLQWARGRRFAAANVAADAVGAAALAYGSARARSLLL